MRENVVIAIILPLALLFLAALAILLLKYNLLELIAFFPMAPSPMLFVFVVFVLLGLAIVSLIVVGVTTYTLIARLFERPTRNTD